ncbi:hypothetical protein FSST1_008689 [Fusarium sambucinum]
MHCNETQCDSCWSGERKHKKPDPGHNKTSLKDAIIVHSTLNVRLDEYGLLKDQIEQLQVPKQRRLDSGASEWFGVRPKNGDRGFLLTEGPAYDLMMEPVWTSASSIYPGLVSFIGETGSGKSSLISLLSKFSSSQLNNLFKTPTVGDSGSTDSTSSNVNLYSDPDSFLKENPLLYADCEGMGGDEVPAAMLGGTAPSTFQTWGLDCRDITWETESANGGIWTRKDITKTLFPRILYIFSDVVVFVPYNRIGLEDYILQLAQWGHSATVQAYNKPVLPGVIIGLINRDGQVDPQNYDLETAKISFFNKSSLKDIARDPKLHKYVEYWEENGQTIATAEELLLCYYSSIDVVHFPNGKDPTRMRQQVGKLYQKINEVCDELRERRETALMKWDATTLPRFVRKAFTHFACNYQTPFNFSDAWVDLQRLSFNYEGSIFDLARKTQKSRGIAGWELWDAISVFAASCLFLNCVRENQPACTPSALHWEQFDKAAERYWNKFWPCNFSIEGKDGLGYCVNAPSGHPHHQIGQHIRGEDKSHKASHTPEQLKLGFRELVDKAFQQFKNTLKSTDWHTRSKEAFKIHQQQMKIFYGTIQDIDEFLSHSTCLICLNGAPEHSLPCGHIICRSCARDVGNPTSGGFLRLKECPLHVHQKDLWLQGWAGFDKPSQAGLRILSLDGGGIKGVVIIEVLRKLQKCLGQIPFRDCFDLIVGTSAGGIIASALGPGCLTIEDCDAKFVEVSNKAFTKPKSSIMPARVGFLVDKMTAFLNQGLYLSEPFETSLKKELSNIPIFGGKQIFQKPSVKTAITTSTREGQVIILSNYNRVPPKQAFYQLQRLGPGHEMQLWEAARATSAAPLYFPPFCRDSNYDITVEGTKQVYLDGGLWHNNPIRIANSEAAAIWPENRHTHPDILLSIGTGYHESEIHANNGTQVYLEQIMNEAVPGAQSLKEKSFLRGIAETGMNQFTSSLNSERIWHEWLEAKSPCPEFESRYRRVNVEFSRVVPMDTPTLDAYNCCREAVQKLPDDLFESISDQLIASCFFFRIDRQATPKRPREAYQCHGVIECRLQPENVKVLGQRFGEMYAIEKLPFFTIKETHKNGPDPVRSVPIENIILQMKEKGEFQIPVTINVTSELAETEILLHMRQKGQVISGLPRKLKDDEDDGVYEAVEKRHDPGSRFRPLMNLLLRRTSNEGSLSATGSDSSSRRHRTSSLRKSWMKGNTKD